MERFDPMEFEDIVAEYDCKENDNCIKVRMVRNTLAAPRVLEELEIGCKDMPSDGWSVIGYEDLVNALNLVGYNIVRTRE